MVAPNSGDSSKPRLSGPPLLAAALGVVLAVQALFVLSYVGALHHPKPHDVAFGVVGNSRLPLAVGKQFSLKVRPYPDEAAARSAIDHRRIDGAFVADSGGGTLLVVPAASNAGAAALGTAFGAAAAALEQKLTVVQVHTLPTGDTSGNVSFLVVMALIVGGYLASTIGMVFGGSARRRGRLASLALASVFGALLTDVFAGPVLDAVPTSKFLALWGLFVLVMTAVAYATAALQTVLGPGGDADRGRALHRLRRAGLGRHRSVGVPSRLLANLRPIPAGRCRYDRRSEHALLRRERDHQVPPDPLRLSHRRSAGSDRRPAAGERNDCRGRSRGLDGGSRHRRLEAKATVRADAGADHGTAGAVATSYGSSASSVARVITTAAASASARPA